MHEAAQEKMQAEQPQAGSAGALDDKIKSLPHIVPSELNADEQWKRNGEYVERDEVLALLAAHDQKVRAEVCEKIARYLEVNHRDDDDAEWEACCNLPDRIRSLTSGAEEK